LKVLLRRERTINCHSIFHILLLIGRVAVHSAVDSLKWKLKNVRVDLFFLSHIFFIIMHPWIRWVNKIFIMQSNGNLYFWSVNLWYAVYSVVVVVGNLMKNVLKYFSPKSKCKSFYNEMIEKNVRFIFYCKCIRYVWVGESQEKIRFRKKDFQENLCLPIKTQTLKKDKFQ
jgi:hypothetical protein